MPLPHGCWGASIAVRVCPAGKLCRVQPLASLLPRCPLPSRGREPPSLVHTPSGLASFLEPRSLALGSGCLTPLRAELPLRDKQQLFLWRRCSVRRPQRFGSRHAHSSTFHAKPPCRLARPATGLPRSVCQQRLPPPAPSQRKRPPEMLTGSGPTAGPRPPGCAALLPYKLPAPRRTG